MKVAILTAGLPPEANGGAEIATLQLAECAAKMGHEVHIVATAPPGSPVLQNKGSRTQNGTLTIHPVPALPLRYIHGVTYIPGAVKAIAKIHPDLVHAQSVYIAPSALLARWLLRTPYLLYERGGVDLNLPINRVIYPLFLRHAHRVVAQTENQKRSLLRYRRRDIEVIPNGVDADRFGKTNKTEAKCTLHFPPDCKIALAVGRCRPEKNMKDFVMAARSVDAIFILVGDGPQLRELESLGSSKVMFAGNVDNSLIPLYMSAADVLVNTSSSEGFPITVLEGLASGLPIVAPRICGIPEIVEDGVNGLLSEPRNHRSTAVMINRILDNPGIARSMSVANKEKAKRYTWEDVVRKLYG